MRSITHLVPQATKNITQTYRKNATNTPAKNAITKPECTTTAQGIMLRGPVGL
jgi:hypothetical protein